MLSAARLEAQAPPNAASETAKATHSAASGGENLRDARIAANRENAQKSTGPRTPEGKAASSRNATTFGLFSAAIVVRPEDQPEFDALAAQLNAEYSPATATEQTFATEALHATWRMRRCLRLESALTDQTGAHSLDPLENPETAPKLASIDRARAQAATALRRALKELRQLQTERRLRAELQIEPTGAGLASYKEIVSAVAQEARSRRTASGQPSLEDFRKLLDKSTNQTQPAPGAPPTFPRNAPCPCGSGLKFKRCCIAARPADAAARAAA